MPDPYEWVDEPAFTTGYESAPRYRVVQSTHPWVSLTGGPFSGAPEMIFQQSFEASFESPDAPMNPPASGGSEPWATALHADFEDEWWRFIDAGVPMQPSWVAWDYAAFVADVPILSRQTSFVNLRLDGDLGAPPIADLPETPSWATLEVSGGQVQALDLDVLVYAEVGNLGHTDLTLGAPAPADVLQHYYGQWQYRIVGTRGGAGAGGATAAVVQSIVQNASPSNIEVGWSQSETVLAYTADGATKAGAVSPDPGPDGDTGAEAHRLVVNYHDRGGALITYVPGPHYAARHSGYYEADPELGRNLEPRVPPVGAIHAYVRGVNVVGVIHQPWRWRWVPKGLGLTRLRQRQTLPGSDSWPLRQRQNGAHTGSWPLRQLQRGV